MLSRLFLGMTVIGALCLLPGRGAWGDDQADIERLYREFNQLMVRSDLDALRPYQTDAFNKAQDECRSDRMCRMSDDISRDAVTLTRYEIVGARARDNGDFQLRARGTISTGQTVDVVVTWKMEDGRWKIDEVAKLPVGFGMRNWNRPEGAAAKP
jgi:hypothetical protein